MKKQINYLAIIAVLFVSFTVSCKKDSNNTNNSKDPVVTLQGNGSVTLNLGDVYTESGATATDQNGNTLTVTISGTVNTEQVADYTITYSATDSESKTGSITRSVKVTSQKLSGTYQATGTNSYSSTVSFSASNFNKLSFSSFGNTGVNTTGTVNGSVITLPNVNYSKSQLGVIWYYELSNITGQFEKGTSNYNIKSFSYKQKVTANGTVLSNQSLTEFWNRN